MPLPRPSKDLWPCFLSLCHYNKGAKGKANVSWHTEQTKESDRFHSWEMLSTKGFNMFGITFAPIFIPLKRRLQTSAVLFMASAIFLGHTIGIVLLLLMFLSKLWPLAVLYASWILLVDYKKSSVGGRRSNLVRNLRIWKHFCEYFPLSLVRTAYLDPKQNYIFGYHPHGVISTGAFGNFGTEGTEFSKVFPGIKPHLLTLKRKPEFI